MQRDAFSFAGDTHPGRKYAHNEDNIGWAPEHGLFLVADGMGGHASGEVASQIVKDTLLRAALTMPLTDALLEAHRAVVAAAAESPNQRSMGSTAVIVRIDDARCDIGWVGDSRVYLLRRGRLRLLTRDHSYIELLLEKGELSEADARTHPDRNLVTQTLGIADPTPSHTEVTLRGGDRLLLCSDGLNDELDDAQITTQLRSNTIPNAQVAALIEAALASGGRDNVSAVVIEYTDRRPLRQRLRSMPINAAWLPAFFGGGAAIVLFLIWYGLFNN